MKTGSPILNATLWTFSLLLSAAAAQSADLVTAGTLHVDLRATNGSAGSTVWTNRGVLGNFTSGGAPTLVNNVAGTGIPGVSFNGSTDYYTGPNTVADLEGASDRTVEVWVLNPSISDEETMVAWSRRGGPEGSNLSINYDSNVGAAGYGAAGHWGGSYDLGWPAADRVPVANEWHHIVYTYDGNRTVLVYVDGALVVSKAIPAPLSTAAGLGIILGSQRESGGSLTTTLRLSGYINTVRVHGGLLSAADVQANYQYGPAFVPPSGPVAFITQPADQAVGEGGSAMFSAAAEGTMPIAYQWYRDGQPIPDATNRNLSTPSLAVEESGAQFFCVASNFFEGTPYTATSAVAQVTVLYVAGTLTHRYSFTTNAQDLIGTANGLLVGGASITNGELVLNGSSAFVDLPNNIVTGYTAITIEIWVTDNGSANWARIFDFGNNSAGENGQGTGSQYMFITLPGGAGNLRYACTVSGNGAEQLLEWPSGRPPAGQKVHIAVTTDGGSRQGRLYVNGQLVGANNNLTITPGSLGNTVNNWIGKSNWTDPYFNGRIDEFRIYAAALPESKIRESYLLGPDQPLSDGPVSITSQPAPTTVVENTGAILTLGVNGRPPFLAQWLKHGTPITGATNLTLVYFPTLAENGAQFMAYVTNVVGGTNYFAVSQSATVSVLEDHVAPTLVRASSSGAQSFEVLFSEWVNPATATNIQNYSVTGPIGIVALTGASLNPDGISVTVFCAPLAFGQTYTVRVNQVQDRAATPNTIAPNSTAPFVAAPFRLRDIGAPGIPSSIAAISGDYEITAGGTGTANGSDQLTLASVEKAGNFDVAVRLGSLGLSDAWASAGLMARSGFTTNATFAATWATPGPAGCFFQARPGINSNLVTTGTFPVNYPDTWLRLSRTGNQFSGFASLDGQSWAPLGTIAIAMPDPVQVGLSVSAASTNTTTSVHFTNFADATGVIVTNAPLPFEPMAPCSRKTGLVISEIMYNPPDLWSTNSLEFIELHNPDLVFEDLSGYRLEGDIDYTFLPGTILPSGGYLVIARNSEAVEQFYQMSGTLGPFSNNLPNEGGTIRLVNEVNGWLLEVNYRDKSPWPVQADGMGHSLVLRRPSYGEDDPRAWMASDRIGGSPGRLDGWSAEPLRQVVVNEFLANSEPPQIDFLELYNAGNSPVDLSGAWLTDDPSTTKFQIPNGTILSPRSYISYTEATLGFALSSDGDEILLVNPGRTRVVEALRFGGQASNISSGRYPNGSPLWSELSALTPGTNNAAALQREIVINEIMFHPLSGSTEDEYVELYNRGSNAVALGGWRLSDGISFTFPGTAVIPAGGYVVVAANVTNLLAKYPQLTAANTFGDFNGSLNNGGERIVLESPLVTLRTNRNGVVSTNVSFITLNEVTYSDGGRWGQWSDGGGSSLELIDPQADNRFAPSWAASDETAKAPWTTIDFTGLLDNGLGQTHGNPDRFELFLQGAGECLLDDLECRSASNQTVNRLTNPGFETGATGWVFQGTHRPSFVESGVGTGGSPALHLVAADRGDPGPNKIRAAIAAMPTSQNGTIRGKARWLAGSPELILRLRGQWIEAAIRLETPANLGTPGLPNSRLVPNAGPAITEVKHEPVLPAAGQPVIVSARVMDPDLVVSALLHYRLDPGTNYSSTPLNDEGMNGDALAGDGIYSGTIPAQASGTMVAFYLEASDASLSSQTSRFPQTAPARECLVRFGETIPSGVMATYRFWVTQANIDTWNLREPNSNEPLDCTFAYGNSRVMYNVNTLYSASPWHTANHPYTGPLGSTVCDYELNFPSDDRFLGSRDFVLAAQDSTLTFFNNDLTGQGEYTCYWFGRKLGLQYNHKRSVRVSLNGQMRGMLYYDHQQPNGEVVSQYFPDDDQGHLYKIEDWFEFDDAGSAFNVITARLLNYTTTGGAKKAARYRYNFRPRSVEGSPNDFADLFALADAVTATGPEPYTSATSGLMDVDQWMRVFALQHAIGNWDSYGYRRGKNCFTYKPTQGKWKLLLWDLELSLGKQGDPVNHPLFDLGSATAVDQGEPTIERMYNHPPFRRAFWRAMYDLVNGPMLASNYEAMHLARYNAFRAHGLPVEDPVSLKNWIEARRAFILTQLPSATFTVALTNYLETGTNSLVLSGTAPVNAQDILINGGAYPITWTSQIAWSLRVPLLTGTNVLRIEAIDSAGNVISNGIGLVSVNFTNAAPAPENYVVINEIMFDPATPQTGYLELVNTHSTFTFDLSGWRINGLDYTFPAGSVIGPKSLLLVARNRSEMAKLYGFNTLVFGEYAGGLDNDGETLTLLRPGTAPGEELTVDKVKYESRAPWPAVVAGANTALQLMDASRDNARVGNWSDGSGWRFFSLTTNSATATANRLSIYFESGGGDMYIDDVSLVTGTVPGSGQNLIANAGFEDPLSPAWKFGPLATNSAATTEMAHSGNKSLHLLIRPGGLSLTTFYQDIAALTTNTIHTLSFWWKPGGPSANLNVRMSSSFRTLVNMTEATARATPGLRNSTIAALPEYPLVWLNEVAANNTTGLADSQGEREPWIELYNSGTTPVSLNDYRLSDNYISLAAWAFPAGVVLQPGEFKVVFADGEPGESTATEWHTSFRLPGGTGSVALSRVADGSPLLMDYLNYDGLPGNASYGSLPDGQLFDRQVFYSATPGAANSDASPVMVYINEWMAANTSAGGFADPADGDYDDWFELYNPGPLPVDLAGYYLTDTLTNQTQFRIPSGYVIPAGGFLLVWADNETGQNQSNRIDLHANFRLGQGGEALGLFAPDGTAVDTMTFGAQTNDVSQGHYLDGTGPVHYMVQPTPRSANILEETPQQPNISTLSVLSGNLISFSVSTTPGLRYQVEYKDDLNQSNWNILVPAQAVSGSSLPVSDPIGARTQRFYRVVVLP